LLKPHATTACIVIALLAASLARAGEDVPIEQQAVILLRALAYDRNIAVDAGGTVDVAVLAHVGDKSVDRTLAAFRALEKNTCGGLPVHVHALYYGGADEVAGKLAGMDALYVTAGAEADLPAIVALARAQHVTTFGAKQSFVEHGLGLGVFVIADKPTILVNVAAAKAEGAQFASELFKIAQAVKP
jgi:hypothetical protein